MLLYANNEYSDAQSDQSSLGSKIILLVSSSTNSYTESKDHNHGALLSVNYSTTYML